MVTKRKLDQTAGVEIVVAPFRVTTRQTKEGFILRFDGIHGNKLVPMKVQLKFPKFWAQHLIDKLAKVK